MALASAEHEREKEHAKVGFGQKEQRLQEEGAVFAGARGVHGWLEG
jgi:hypothetical protein